MTSEQVWPTHILPLLRGQQSSHFRRWAQVSLPERGGNRSSGKVDLDRGFHGHRGRRRADDDRAPDGQYAGFSVPPVWRRAANTHLATHWPSN